MRVVIGILFILYAFNAFSQGLKAVNDNGRLVYTNSADFFQKALVLSKKYNYSKERVTEMIKKIAADEGVDYRLVYSIASVESDFNDGAVSNKGAVGVMQLMKKTAASYGVKNIDNVEENIRGGVKFLKHLMVKYNDIKLAAAAYNAGETAVDKYNGVPPYDETRRYVAKVLKKYGKYTHNMGRSLIRIGDTYTNTGALW